jgi:asparagine synthetase B (glutamine-hydrolysing)
MMYGGKVELRTPFMNKEVIDFGLRIPTRYRDEKDGKGNVMKYILRKAFEGDISDDLLWRPKKTFQIGCHTAYLKNEKERIEDLFEDLFVNHNVRPEFIKRHIGHNRGRIEKIIIEK